MVAVFRTRFAVPGPRRLAGLPMHHATIVPRVDRSYRGGESSPPSPIENGSPSRGAGSAEDPGDPAFSSGLKLLLLHLQQPSALVETTWPRVL
jgi:hypothetical protein